MARFQLIQHAFKTFRLNLLNQFDRQPLPHFIVLGTQKGGTTTLHKLLMQHPGIYLPEQKELHYFTFHTNKPASWYASHYNLSHSKQKRGEITPYYLFHPEVPKRIQTLLPSVKLIVLLRDPLERTLSQYFHAKRLGFEHLSLEEALNAEQSRLKTGNMYSHQKHSYLSRSLYLEQLSRYERLFPESQLLILRSEDLFTDPKKIWRTIENFIGVFHRPILNEIPQENAGNNEAKQVDQLIRSRLEKELLPTINGVKERYGFGWKWEDH